MTHTPKPPQCCNPLAAARGWMIFLGVILCLKSIVLAASGVGLVVIWVPFVVAVTLFRLAAFVSSPEADATQALERVRRYFKWHGILVICMTAVGVLAILTGLTKAFLGALIAWVLGSGSP